VDEGVGAMGVRQGLGRIVGLVVVFSKYFKVQMGMDIVEVSSLNGSKLSSDSSSCEVKPKSLYR
jgi:hypothetical protein